MKDYWGIIYATFSLTRSGFGFLDLTWFVSSLGRPKEHSQCMNMCSVFFYGSGLCPGLAVDQVSVVTTLSTVVPSGPALSQDFFMILYQSKYLSIEDAVARVTFLFPFDLFLSLDNTSDIGLLLPSPNPSESDMSPAVFSSPPCSSVYPSIPTNVWPALYFANRWSNGLKIHGLFSPWRLLMTCNLCVDQNGPIGAELWKYEDACPTAAQYPPSPDATTNKRITNYVLRKPPVQWPPNPRILFSSISTDGL